MSYHAQRSVVASNTMPILATTKIPKLTPAKKQSAPQVDALGLKSLPSHTPYGLDRCQIDTPDKIVKGFWKLIKRHRRHLGSVIDLGAGDGRFAIGAKYDEYQGYEIDPERGRRTNLPPNAKLIHKCAFEVEREDFSVCVGNPPYVRHHDIDGAWREELTRRIKKDLGFTLNRLANLFVYFICLAILKTKSDGLIAMLVPYEWVSRPSAKALRDFISSKKWDVHVYRFKDEIFKGVLTTASISIIDKAGTSGAWKFYDIDSDFNVEPKRKMSGSNQAVLNYLRRPEKVWALRGLSPGSQEIFVLTEDERTRFHLKKTKDVRPCVTSLRGVPKTLQRLTPAAFKKHYIDKGNRCWLIRSNGKLSISKELRKYLKKIPASKHDNYTCNNRRPWYAFKQHPSPKVLYASGFTSFGPKIVSNDIHAIAVGSVHGIHSDRKQNAQKIVSKLRNVNFERQVVAHAGSLKKVEVGQMNSTLHALFPIAKKKEIQKRP